MQEISFRNDILPLKDKLFRLALQIVFDRAEAEDVVQETLIRVWNKRDEWTQFGSIEAYCLTVARNLAIDRSEKKDSDKVILIDASKLGEVYKDGSNQKRRLRPEEEEKIVSAFRNKESIDDFSIAVSYSDIKNKGVIYEFG